MPQSELFLQKLDSVVSQLQADMPDSKFDRKSLAILLAQLLQFMEDALGKEACPTLHEYREGTLT